MKNSPENEKKCCNPCDILESIAFEEAAIAHILNAEGEKIQKAISLNCTTENLLKINSSVNETIQNVTSLEVVLLNKLKTALEWCNNCDFECKPCQCLSDCSNNKPCECNCNNCKTNCENPRNQNQQSCNLWSCRRCNQCCNGCRRNSCNCEKSNCTSTLPNLFPSNFSELQNLEKESNKNEKS